MKSNDDSLYSNKKSNKLKNIFDLLKQHVSLQKNS